MSYRLPDKRRHIGDHATQSLIEMDNGTITRISIPCTYEHETTPSPTRYDRMMCDHIGWPSPDSPDRSCQDWHCCHDRCAIAIGGIDLTGEGYESVETAMLDAPEGVSMIGEIDYESIVLEIRAMCDKAQAEDIDVSFAVYVVGTAYPDEQPMDLRDLVTKGTLRIVAGPIPHVEPEPEPEPDQQEEDDVNDA